MITQKAISETYYFRKRKREEEDNRLYDWRQAQTRIGVYRKTGVLTQRLFTEAEMDEHCPVQSK